MKKWKDLINVMERLHTFDYPGDDCKGSIKRLYKTKSKAFFKELTKDLQLKEFKADFNAGGPAVCGDPSLYGMWSGSEGIAIYLDLNSPGKKLSLMYRKISHMKDYKGERNRWLHDLETVSYDNLVRTLLTLKPTEKKKASNPCLMETAKTNENPSAFNTVKGPYFLFWFPQLKTK